MPVPPQKAQPDLLAFGSQRHQSLTSSCNRPFLPQLIFHSLQEPPKTADAAAIIAFVLQFGFAKTFRLVFGLCLTTTDFLSILIRDAALRVIAGPRVIAAIFQKEEVVSHC